MSHIKATSGGWLHRFRASLAAQLYSLVAVLSVVAWSTFYWGHLHSETSGMALVRQHASTLSLAYAEHLQRALQEAGQTLQSSAEGTPEGWPHPLLVLNRQKQRLRSAGPTWDADEKQWHGAVSESEYTGHMAVQLATPGANGTAAFVVQPLQKAGQLTGFAVTQVPAGFFAEFQTTVRDEETTRFSVISDTHAGAQTAHLVYDEANERMQGIRRLPAYDLAVVADIDVAHQMAPDRTRKHIVLVFAVLFPLALLAATRAILSAQTHRHALKQAMHARERLAASVFEHAREGIMITDTSGAILDVNSTYTHITDFSREESIGKNPRILKSDRQSPSFYAAMWQELRDKGHWTGDVWNRRKDGELFAALLTISAVRDDHGKPQHYVALFTDVTEQREQQKQLAHLAHYDALSSLPNRVLLADRLRQAMLQSQRRAQMLAVAFLDLDGFKSINDRHGHDVGDALLVHMAQQLKGALRDGDTLSRIGGDEFVAVLVDLNHQSESYPVLDRMMKAVQRPVQVTPRGSAQALELHITASIGVTYFPQKNVDADHLIRQADQAMYQAKRSGKNRYHQFDIELDAALQVQTETQERMRLALERREFVLHYQPKVNLETGAVTGMEALIRWQHPERGLLAPAVFLPVIEDHPLSIDVGQWVLQTALAQLANWKNEGLDINVSVNVGARQMQQGTFAAQLAKLLATHPALMPGCLELEILENSAMEDMAKVTENIDICHGLGVRFALDDFGTGYSSLTYLKRLPADLLKIDQSFVRDMLEDPDDLAIVKSIIGLAQTFQRSVIAEGVETREHGDLLVQLDCPLAQGYGISRPMPPEQVADWVRTWVRDFKPRD